MVAIEEGQRAMHDQQIADIAVHRIIDVMERLAADQIGNHLMFVGQRRHHHGMVEFGDVAFPQCLDVQIFIHNCAS